MAAAIGAGLPIEDPKGTFIVDIGGGTTEIAVISLGGIVLGRSIRIAGDEMDEAIINYFRLKYALLLGQPTAEGLKIQIGSFSGGNEERFTVIRGRDLESGLPKSMKVSSLEVREALSPVIQEIVGHIKDALEEAPPELVSDIAEDGIVLAGGGSLISGIDKVIEEATKTPVIIADDAITCVVRGCGHLLANPPLLSKVNVTAGLK
jgi:rod shape-determining protein MreB